MIIAIDGEASTGKSTQAKKIAKRLNINYRDSGAYYRAITLFLIQNQINPKEIIGSDIFSKIDISQKFENNIFSIFLNFKNPRCMDLLRVRVSDFQSGLSNDKSFFPSSF